MAVLGPKEVMALIKCNECQREISDKATSCPGCGAPISVSNPPPQEVVNERSDLKRNVAMAAAVALACAGFAYYQHGISERRKLAENLFVSLSEYDSMSYADKLFKCRWKRQREIDFLGDDLKGSLEASRIYQECLKLHGLDTH